MSRLHCATLVIALARSLSAQSGSADSARHHEVGVMLDSAPPVRVRIDSARSEALITIGPLRIPASTPYNHHFAPPPAPFTWPATGWVGGFRIELLDSAGRILPREMLHHAGVTNLDRRQLAYPIAERLFAA